MSNPTVHPSFITLLEKFLNFLRTEIEPAVAVAEKVAPIVEAVDPALAPAITGAEAAVAAAEGVVNKL